MATVIEFRNGKRTEHDVEDEALDFAWDWAEKMNRMYWDAVRLPLNMMEATMQMQDMKRVTKKGEVIHAANRFRPMATERRIETRRCSGNLVRVTRRRKDDDDTPGGAA